MDWNSNLSLGKESTNKFFGAFMETWIILQGYFCFLLHIEGTYNGK